MKRRNVESSAGKLRRAAKRSKISDGYSYFCQFKFLFVWAFVIVLDFVADFRFELLYPFWVFFSSVSETFKFKGVSYLFSYIFLTLTVDMICYYMIPVHWLFFASSTYVWLQFTWYSERGMTLFSIFIWMFVICMEAFFRLRELKAMPLQFEICKPFAAHGIGYPIITLGVGCKSYVHYRFRLHTKRVVAKENEFYYSLLQKALVPELLTDPNGPESLEYAPSSAVSSSSAHHSNNSNFTSTSSSSSSSSKYLLSSASSGNVLVGSGHRGDSGGSEVSAGSSAYPNATSTAHKSQSISVQSNGSGHVSSRTSSAVARSNANASGGAPCTSNSQAILSDSGDRTSPTARQPFFLIRTVISTLLRLFFTAEQHASSCASRFLAASLTSIHSVTFKVLSMLTFANALSTGSEESGKKSGNNAVSSLHTHSATSSMGAAGEGAPAGASKECTVSSKQRRKGSLIGDVAGRTVEEVLASSESASQSQAVVKSSRHQNGSLTRGKGNSEGTEALKKSSSSKVLELPKTLTNEVKSSSSSCNGHSSSNLPLSTTLSSTELANKKSNISSNSAPQTETGKVPLNSCIGTKSAEVAILNGTCGNLNKIGKIPADQSTVELQAVSNGTTLPLAPPLKIRKNKRSSLEDPRTLLEMIKTKDDVIWKIEGDNQRLKAELQTIRQCEKDLRQQVSGHLDGEKLLKANISGLQLEIEALQRKMQATAQGKQQDKTSIQRLERLLEDERRKAKTSSEMQAVSEKKARLAEETAARASAMAEAVKNVCSEGCRQRQRDIEMEITNMRKELYAKEDQMRIKDAMLDEAKGLKDKGNMLMSALSAMHDKNSQLEETLNMEKMLKMDIYAHLEDYKQQLSKQRVISMTQEKQIRELKQKLALYSGSTQQQQHNSFGVNVGLANLNGFNTSPGNSSSSVNDIELVNRCFSSCSPNSVVASAASPSSLSSGTPPLPVGSNQSAQSMMEHHRSLCNVSPVGTVGSGACNSSAMSVNSVNASPFGMLSLRDYSLDNCLNSTWPSSLHNNSKSSSHPNHCSQMANQSPSPSSSSLMGGHNLSSSSSVSSACSSLIGSHSMVTSNGGAPSSSNSKAPGTLRGGAGVGALGGNGTKLTDYENAPNKGVTPNLSFTNRFDI